MPPKSKAKKRHIDEANACAAAAAAAPYVPAEKWKEFDSCTLSRRVQVDATTRMRWDEAEANKGQEKLQREDVAAVLQITPDEALTAEDLVLIGAMLVDEFDPSKIDLKQKINPDYMHQKRKDRAPGVTDEQLQKWEAVFNSFFRCKQSWASFSHDRMERILCTPEAKQEEEEEEEEVDSIQPEPLVEVTGFLPVCWLVQQLHLLPLKREVKEMHCAHAMATASSLKGSSWSLWAECVTTISGIKQDIVDFLWHGARAMEEAEEQNKRARL